MLYAIIVSLLTNIEYHFKFNGIKIQLRKYFSLSLPISCYCAITYVQFNASHIRIGSKMIIL